MEITALTFEILLALSDEDRHGYGIIKEIEGRDSPAPSTGAMYLALHRMQAEGLVRQVPAPSKSGDARRRYYRITDEGRGRSASGIRAAVASCRSRPFKETAGRGRGVTRLILGAILRLAPAAFRERYGTEILTLHLERSRERRSPAKRLVFATREIWGLVVAASQFRDGRT